MDDDNKISNNPEDVVVDDVNVSRDELIVLVDCKYSHSREMRQADTGAFLDTVQPYLSCFV